MKNIKITCPICNVSQTKSIPDIVVKSITKEIDDKNKKVPLHIPVDVICEHSFIVILDQDFQIEGYEQVEQNTDSNEIKAKHNNNNTNHISLISFDEVEEMIHKLDKKAIKNIINRL